MDGFFPGAGVLRAYSPTPPSVVAAAAPASGSPSSASYSSPYENSISGIGSVSGFGLGSTPHTNAARGLSRITFSLGAPICFSVGSLSPRHSLIRTQSGDGTNANSASGSSGATSTASASGWIVLDPATN